MDFNEDKAWKQTFLMDNFSVDQCLSKYTQKSFDLEQLRSELRHYGNELQQQMSEILKTETEAIVNLAEYLTSLNSKIEDLSIPICQLREEIRTMYDLTQTAETSYKTTFEKMKQNNSDTSKTVLKLELITTALYIHDMIATSDGDVFEDLVILDRMVNKYSLQRNYLDELNVLSPDAEDTVNKVESKLIEMINKKFLIAVNNNNPSIIASCLRMYDNLGKQDEAQNTYRIEIVRPTLTPLFSEKNLEKYDYDVNKIYEEVEYFIENKMNVIRDVVKTHPELNSYNFVLNSFWCEFDKQSRESLPFITAPGNPELFQNRFTSTWNLLKRIARKCGNENLIREDDSFLQHIARFNLPVYFEIRFQQIAGKFETDIYTDDSAENYYCDSNELNCKLKITLALWNAVQKCFSSEVFILQLADQFVKLFMMLLSRYLKWFKTILNNEQICASSFWEGIAVNSLIDLNIIKNLIAPDTEDVQNVNQTIFAVLHDNLKPTVLKLFKNNKDIINDVSNFIKNRLIKLKMDESLTQLDHVEAIPRLYRRTNRGPPKEPSQYIIDACKPINGFFDNHKTVIKDDVTEILSDVVVQISLSYSNLVQKVLNSVCKTEESLRRLKNRNLGNTDDNTASQNDTMSDEMKIREQIRYDVEYFLEKMNKMELTTVRKALENLKSEIQ